MLRINALGRLVVVGESGPILGSAAQPRRLALLAVLARAGARGVTRTRIIELLWPESDEEHGRGVLSKALSALRRDLGAEDVFLATNNDVRLNPAVVASDLSDLDAALAAGRLDDAAGLYVGPFLDGFRVAGATDFERWASAERASIERDFIAAVRALAEAAGARGDHSDAARWWTKLAAYEPLNTRHTLGLMRSLVAAGEPRAALQHARVYELLLADSLDVPADADVIALATDIRASMLPGNKPGATSGTEQRHEPVATSAPAGGRYAPSRAWMIAALVMLPLVAIGAAGVWRMSRPALPQARVIAFGRITDHRGGSPDSLAAAVMDRIAAGVARAGTVRVTTLARAGDILAEVAPNADVGDALVAAARSAGATELVDGGLFLSADTLRLDLRRTDLAGGALRAMPSVAASDPGKLADLAAAQLLSALGIARSREPEDQLSAGLGLIAAGRALDALAPLHRAIALDAASIGTRDTDCVACDALVALIAAYRGADSVSAAERVAQAWVRRDPTSAAARAKLAEVVAWRDSVRAGSR